MVCDEYKYKHKYKYEKMYMNKYHDMGSHNQNCNLSMIYHYVIFRLKTQTFQYRHT